MKKIIVLFLIVFGILSSSLVYSHSWPGYLPTCTSNHITSCCKISSSGDYYITNPISGKGRVTASELSTSQKNRFSCIEITANNVNLDLRGQTITDTEYEHQCSDYVSSALCVGHIAAMIIRSGNVLIKDGTIIYARRPITITSNSYGHVRLENIRVVNKGGYTGTNIEDESGASTNKLIYINPSGKITLTGNIKSNPTSSVMDLRNHVSISSNLIRVHDCYSGYYKVCYNLRPTLEFFNLGITDAIALKNGNPCTTCTAPDEHGDGSRITFSDSSTVGTSTVTYSVASSCGSNGATCTDDADCCSGWVCDNDDTTNPPGGLTDDFHCYQASGTGNVLDSEDSDCEYDTGNVDSYFADERTPYEIVSGGREGVDGCPSDSHCGVNDVCESADRDYHQEVCEYAGVGQGQWIDTSGALYNGVGVDSNDCGPNFLCGDNDFTNGFCCEDDGNEFYKTSTIFSVDYESCCDNVNDCVDETGACQSGLEDVSSGTCDWDGLDNNCDGETDWDFADGIHGDINCKVSIDSNPSITGGLAPE